MIRQARMGTMAQAKTAGLKDYERRYRELLGELSEIGFIRSGSVAPRYNYCGKANCRCHADPPQPHGPYSNGRRRSGARQ
jgi:hypothetical protein